MNRPKKNARPGEPKRAALASTWNLQNGGGATTGFQRGRCLLLVATFSERPELGCVYCPDCGFTAAGTPQQIAAAARAAADERTANVTRKRGLR